MLPLGDCQLQPETTETTSIEWGNNQSLVLVNSRLDYIYRGKELENVCLYDFTANWQKRPYKDEELKAQKKPTTRHRNPIARFQQQHPQVNTHLMHKRSRPYVPVLPTFPPTKSANPEKFAQFILLLFKPFRTTADLLGKYNTCFEASTRYDFPHSHQLLIHNIEEMSIGRAEKKAKDAARNLPDTSTEDILTEYTELDPTLVPLVDEEQQLIDQAMTDETTTNLDKETEEAIAKINNFKLNCLPLHQADTASCAQFPIAHSPDTIRNWKKDIDKHKVEAVTQQTAPPADANNSCVSASTDFHELDQRHQQDVQPMVVDIDSHDMLINTIIATHTLNAKQQQIFKLVVENPIKRLCAANASEPLQQKLIYLGGHGGNFCFIELPLFPFLKYIFIYTYVIMIIYM